MYAAPTHGPNAVAGQKRCCGRARDLRGIRPYTSLCRAGVHARRGRLRQTPVLPFTCRSRAVRRGRMYAAPTMRGIHHAGPATGGAAGVRRAAYMPPLRIDRTRSRRKNGIIRQTVFGLCTRYRVFVGEAYMPPGRGAPSRGVCGETDRIPRFVGRGLDPALHYCF